LRLQRLVYQVGEALRQELPTERLYILSLGCGINPPVAVTATSRSSVVLSP
jgi:uroporphyrinogen-III decarboxylase